MLLYIRQKAASEREQKMRNCIVSFVCEFARVNPVCFGFARSPGHAVWIEQFSYLIREALLHSLRMARNVRGSFR